MAHQVRSRIWTRRVLPLTLVGTMGLTVGLLLSNGSTRGAVTFQNQASSTKLTIPPGLLSGQLSRWLSEPGCPAPTFKPASGDFEQGNDSLLAQGLELAWDILKSKCTADSPGLPSYFYSIPVGTIVRDPSNGHAELVTQQGWKSIPTGGDYICFTHQGHPVLELPGLIKYTMGFTAGTITCSIPTPSTPTSPSVTAPQAAPPPAAAPPRASSAPTSLAAPAPPVPSPAVTAPPVTSPPTTSPAPSPNPPTVQLTVDATSAFGVCQAPNVPSYCGGDAHAQPDPNFVAGRGTDEVQGTQVTGVCWKDGGNIEAPATGEQSNVWIETTLAPDQWMNELYFAPGATDGLAQCS